MAAEITQIDTQDFTSQTYEGSDTSLLSQFEIDTSLTSNSYIEYFVYDNNKNLLSTDYSFSEYTVLNDGQSAGTNNSLSQIEIDPEKSLINSGYDQGEYITYFNILNKQIGSELQQLYITEISSDRTEIRLDSTSLTESDIVEQTNIFIQERENSAYFLDFYLNFGDNNLFISNNISLDNQDPTNPTVLIKLYEPLSDEFDINSTLWVVTVLEEPIAYKVTFEDIPIIFTDTTGISGPNFNLDLKDQVNNSSLELSYADLVLTSLTSSANQLNSLLEEKEIDINVDYTDFSNFTHFSSVQSRIENFYYKVGLIENYSSSIATLNNTINNNPSASIAIYESKINNIITNFDGYDYYLYYSSESLAYPKTNSSPPYNLYSTTSPTVLTWLGSANETSIYYGGILLSASIYDNLNQNNLYFTIPEYLREDPANDPYQLFIEMVGQHYDNIWIYYKDVTQKYNADNRLENGISKDIVADAIRDFGIKLYQNNFSNEDLYTAFLGLTPEGGLFPFPNITGSLPTPSGYEYVNTKISASNDYLPLDDVNKSLYKRIYHNLPYLLQTKGTLPGLRALITSYGIPDTILRIKEYGGKDKVNTNDWDYWQNEFNYAYKQNGNNFISSSFVLNSSWGAHSDNPETVMFRFKTNGLPTSSIPIFQTLFSLNSNHTSLLHLHYTGSSYTSGSYSGSIINPNYQYVNLKFQPDRISQPNHSSSISLPFFNGDWWSVMVKRTGTGLSTNFELLSGNKTYDSGENGTSIGFFASSSVTASDAPFIASTQAFFGITSIYSSFSGSFQEIRYYSKPISESVFKDYIMNPSSIEGNSINSGADQLAFRLPLGGELYTGSNSIHPKVTGSWVTTSSFASNSTASFNSTPTFVKNTEYFYYDQPIAGIKNAIADKIRIENNVIPGGDVLSPFMSLSQQANISQSYTANTNLLEVAFSPQDEINDDINSSLGFFNIGEYIGDPRLRSSSAEFYPDLNALRNSYFQKYTKNYNLVDFFRLIKFFDNSLFKMIKDFVPARTSLASGIIVKQHILERNKVPQPQVDTNSIIAKYAKSGSIIWNEPIITKDLTISGTISPQWNDYNESTVENFDGGTAGVFEMFNGTAFAPSGSNIFNLTQSWSESIQTISGSVNVIHNSQDEFYNGEFEGSTLIITTQSLNSPLPNSILSFDYTPVRYSPQNYGLNSSSSFAESQFLSALTVPDQGEILLLSPYSLPFNLGTPTKGTNSSIYVKIHKKDNNGFDNDVALGQATRLRIKYTTLSDYVTIGNILTKTEYSTYWLYKVQSLGSNTADNYIKDYSVSASNITPILLPSPSSVLNSFNTISGNTSGSFNNSSGIYTTSQTSNVALIVSSSITTSGSAGIGLFLIASSGSGILSQKTITTGANITTTISASYYPLGTDLLYFGIIQTGNLTLKSGSFLITQSIASSSAENDSVIIEPYITEPNFYNSDDNALLNSINEQRESTFALDIDYSDGTTPVNFALLITGSATPATVPDSNYTSKKSTLLKYDGSKSTSQHLNYWTPEDIGTYGKLPTIESLKTYIAYCDNDTFGGLSGWPPEHENASAMFVKYLIKADGTVVIPNTTPDSLSIMQQTFLTGERVFISTGGGGSSLDPYRTIIRGGSHLEPILYTQFGQLPGVTFNTTMSFEDIVLSPNGTVGNYMAQYSFTGSNTNITSPPNTENPIPFNSTLYGVPLFSNGYKIPSNIVEDGVNLIFNLSLTVNTIFNNNIASGAYFQDYEILLYNMTTNQLVSAQMTGNGQNTTIAGDLFFSHTIDNSNLNTGDEYEFFIKYFTTGTSTNIINNANNIIGFKIINNSQKITINQYPIPNSTILIPQFTSTAATSASATVNLTYISASLASVGSQSLNINGITLFYTGSATVPSNTPTIIYIGTGSFVASTVANYVATSSAIFNFSSSISPYNTSLQFISSSNSSPNLLLTSTTSNGLTGNSFFVISGSTTSSFTGGTNAKAFNTIWNWGNKTTYPYIITSSNSTLVELYGDPNVKAKDITGSGFNSIQLPWNIKIGDEFKFEGREDFAYMVKNVYGAADSGSGRVFQTGSLEVHFNANLPVSASSSVFNLDHFLIRRYVDDAAQNVITGFKPPGSTGPYLIRPEFIIPELNKNIDEVILDLTQKGLIT